jgi:hypothetical protein
MIGEKTALSTSIQFENHGKCAVALIDLNGFPKRIYHYSKTIGEEESWALRDYFRGEILRSGDSSHTASQIEALVEGKAESPAYRSVKMTSKWKADCEEASKRQFGSNNIDLTSANPPILGAWRRMNSQGS